MLEDEVKKIVKRESLAYSGGERAFVQDVRENGCSSGTVTSLLHSEDAIKFYEAHKGQINGLLADMMDDFGVNSPADIINGWDASDPLALDTVNRVLLAWLAFEHTLESIYGND